MKNNRFVSLMYANETLRYSLHQNFFVELAAMLLKKLEVLTFYDK
jgi:hypothetical protein